MPGDLLDLRSDLHSLRSEMAEFSLHLQKLFTYKNFVMRRLRSLLYARALENIFVIINGESLCVESNVELAQKAKRKKNTCTVFELQLLKKINSKTHAIGKLMMKQNCRISSAEKVALNYTLNIYQRRSTALMAAMQAHMDNTPLYDALASLKCLLSDAYKIVVEFL